MIDFALDDFDYSKFDCGYGEDYSHITPLEGCKIDKTVAFSRKDTEDSPFYNVHKLKELGGSKGTKNKYLYFIYRGTQEGKYTADVAVTISLNYRYDCKELANMIELAPQHFIECY